jgi:GTP-binding protein HflX
LFILKIEKGGKKTRTIIVPRKNHNKTSISEFKNLAKAAGYEVIGLFKQSKKPNTRFFIGKGKAEELANMSSSLQAEKIIFEDELKIKQIHNLSKLAGIEIIDRFQLILEIFQKRSSTAESKLQIELARLRYELSNAKEKVRLAKMSEQPGFLGLGKYEVDVYYQAVNKQVKSIQKKMFGIRKRRILHRQHREKLGFPLVSLAGYTNSGKSTLFNSLTAENVLADSQLFTTLSTTTRKVNLLKEKIILTDTVGFIDRLPLTLIESFRSTFEETKYSDLILLVIDINESPDENLRKITCCLDTIHEVGAQGIPIIFVLNKIDLLKTEDLEKKTKMLMNFTTNIVSISALNMTNLDLLKDKMTLYLKKQTDFSFTIPLKTECFSLLSWIFDQADVHKVKYDEHELTVSLRATQSLMKKIRDKVIEFGGFLHEFKKNIHS